RRARRAARFARAARLPPRAGAPYRRPAARGLPADRPDQGFPPEPRDRGHPPARLLAGADPDGARSFEPEGASPDARLCGPRDARGRAGPVAPPRPRRPVTGASRRVTARPAEHESSGDDAAKRASGSSFYSAMRILPPAQRQAMFEIYSF